MFAQATQQARAVMDTPALQPIGGMQALMMRPTEVELVRECFRWLFNDDDGDLKKRQGRVEMFADQVNGRFRRCLPRMAKFTQTAGSAALYLSLLEPEDNYFFVHAEAKAWAAYFGYDEDFGTGAAFNLTQYYAMCDDLLNELPKYDELTRLHTEAVTSARQMADGESTEDHNYTPLQVAYRLTNGSTVHYFKGSERVTEAVQYYYPVHHWSAWTAIETDDGAVDMERTCVDCGKTETAKIPDPCVGDEYCAGGVFDDVPAASDWMHEGIDYCVLFGLMNGVGKIQFGPRGQTTRAMLVSILYRMAGEPDVSELPEAPFVDVSDDTWYTAAVRWAYANEVVLGTDDTHFAPDARLARAQLVTMLYRAYGPEKGVRPRPIGGYTDWNTVPDWAYSATTWAVSMGILYGTSSTELSPNTGANRAQLALFMMLTCRLQGELDS